jgi:hypothetical protein
VHGQRWSVATGLTKSKYLWIFGNVIPQKLRGDKTVQIDVFRLINHTHTAAAQLFDDAIVRNSLADYWR